MVQVLGEMEDLTFRDLKEFIFNHKCRYPAEKIDFALNKILEKTGGRYRETLRELVDLIENSLIWQNNIS